ncbi:MAG: hypothetical protein LQ337_001288 [Flavoplaca oasis]|nr:MAG: hypothetical protein LQ337_001288 [Flavoplaca oasis]
MSLDLETDMDTPTAKRIRIGPSTPIDDFDDLYEDSPANNMDRTEGLQMSIGKPTVQESKPSLQSTSFQLPGLGLFAAEGDDLKQRAYGENGLISPYDAAPLPPIDEVQVQSSLPTEGESLQELREANHGQADNSGQIDALSNGEIHQCKTSGEMAAPVSEIHQQKQPRTEEHLGAEESMTEAASHHARQPITVKQPLIDGLFPEVLTDRRGAGGAGPKLSEPLSTIDPNKDLGGSMQDSLRQTEETPQVGLTQPLKIQQNEDEMSPAEAANHSKGSNIQAMQSYTDPVIKDATLDQRVEELTTLKTQDNVEGYPNRDLDTSMDLSGNTNVTQAALASQVELEGVVQPGKGEILEPDAEANAENGEAEFELDSSPIESSSESASDSSSSSSGASDYELLDPEEEARRLMQEDGGSDDEGKGGKAASGPLRTLNEKPDEIIPKPQVEITPEMIVSELGSVEHVVENSILIKGKTSGERRALESGSLLCLENRSVIGVIAELLGQVHQPYYSVRFTNPAAIAEAGVFKGTRIFYVEQHSSYVFTQSLKALKGSDASNIHDEEVGDDELEFSDDEAEAEHKRRVKQERQARRGDRDERSDRGSRGGRTNRGGRNDRGGRGNRGDGFSKGPRGGYGRGEGRGHFNQTEARDTSSPTMNYDDNEDGDELYTPLVRPSNLHEIMGRGEAPQESPNDPVNGSPGAQRFHRGGRPERGRGRGDRGRGDRGRFSRGGRGDGGNRGGSNRNSRYGQYNNQEQQHLSQNPSSPSHNTNYASFPPSANGYITPTPNGWPNQFQPGPSVPSYQQPHYIPPQHDHQYNPSQYPYPSPQNQHTQNYNHQFNPYQAASPTAPVTPSIPAGAHINPAFFAQALQQQQQQQQNHNNANNNASQMGGGVDSSPQPAEAFKAAQDRLDLLRQLTRNAGSSG